jgi:hypothetical protein
MSAPGAADLHQKGVQPMAEVFPIVPAGRGPVLTFGVAVIVLLGFLCFAASAPALVFGTVTAVSVALLGLIGSFVYASRRARFELSPEGLAIRGDLYGRRIPAGSLLNAEAKAVDLTLDQDYRPTARTNGAGFPGYGSGWFRLGNGGKALIFVTDKRRVVYLPTREGYAVLLSVAEPERFLAALREMV